MYGIIYRLLQTALNAHTAKLYPASCRVIVNRIMSLLAHHVQNSFSWLTACGPVSSLWPWDWSVSHATVKQTPSSSSLLEAASKERWQASEEELLPPWAVVQHISSTAIILLSMYVLVLFYAVILLSCIYLSINSFYIYNAFFTNLRALCRTTLDTWQDCFY